MKRDQGGDEDSEPPEDGRLWPSPTFDELEREHGQRVRGAEFSRRWGRLSRDGEG